MTALVKDTLRAFDSASLTESTRSAFRISRLLGHAKESWLFSHDLKPLGGAPSLNEEEVRRLFSDPSGYTNEFSNETLEIWIQERTPNMTVAEAGSVGMAQDAIFVGSIESLERRIVDFTDRATQVATVDKVRYALRIELVSQILERIRSRTFSYLCRVETELFISEKNFNIFTSRQNRTDEYLVRIAPHLLDEFNAAYRRAEEGESTARSHALHSCRRIIEKVADIVCVASTTPHHGKDGKEHPLGQQNYMNRILKFLENNLDRTTFSESLLVTLEDIVNRTSKLADLAQKGVHDQVNMNEMEWCVIQTYLLVGEILEVYAAISAIQDLGDNR